MWRGALPWWVSEWERKRKREVNESLRVWEDECKSVCVSICLRMWQGESHVLSTRSNDFGSLSLLLTRSQLFSCLSRQWTKMWRKCKYVNNSCAVMLALPCECAECVECSCPLPVLMHCACVYVLCMYSCATQYAVRGAVVIRAEEHKKTLRAGITLPLLSFFFWPHHQFHRREFSYESLRGVSVKWYGEKALRDNKRKKGLSYFCSCNNLSYYLPMCALFDTLLCVHVCTVVYPHLSLVAFPLWLNL